VLFCLWFSIRTLRLPSVTVGDTLAVERDRGDIMAMVGIQAVGMGVVDGTVDGTADGAMGGDPGSIGAGQ